MQLLNPDDARSAIVAAFHRFRDGSRLALGMTKLSGDTLAEEMAAMFGEEYVRDVPNATIDKSAAAQLAKDMGFFHHDGKHALAGASLILLHGFLEVFINDLAAAVAQGAPEAMTGKLEIDADQNIEAALIGDGRVVVEAMVANRVATFAQKQKGKWRGRATELRRQFGLSEIHFDDACWRVLEHGRIARNVIVHASGMLKEQHLQELGEKKLLGRFEAEQRIAIEASDVAAFAESSTELCELLCDCAEALIDAVSAGRSPDWYEFNTL